MISEEQHKLLLLERDLKDIDSQVKRLVSHLESEQRVTGNISKRVDTVEKLHEKHESMLINSGKGLMFRMNNIEQREQASRSNLTTWVSILALLIALGSMISKYIN